MNSASHAIVTVISNVIIITFPLHGLPACKPRIKQLFPDRPSYPFLLYLYTDTDLNRQWMLNNTSATAIAATTQTKTETNKMKNINPNECSPTETPFTVLSKSSIARKTPKIFSSRGKQSLRNAPGNASEENLRE
ncbi:hypothetical protein ASPTUDRAFT_657056 [Aspergillus tubingensis CBS 134.48]|uniref:Uncharacterized protein n=1 Tax=Aspergillus tubingensis (strain CBS 134.48) TaxID=767770 RepID=A0A1L9N4T0_ASPTC|nr:hypothetical protein ASPTUDRAFT_657056 [Aspergillus tubingensis CBS 134.48]